MLNMINEPRPVQKPVCAGSGLVALDLVISDAHPREPRAWAGGSCGNVLTILAYLGWHSLPIARLRNDTAGSWVKDDLTSQGVDTRFVTQDATGSTPVIVQHIRRDKDGNPRHRYDRVCPYCNSWFSGYKTVLAREAPSVAEELPELDAFYFDRATRATVTLAQAAKSLGAFVVFEPSSQRHEGVFKEALSVADVIKYADDRVKGLDEVLDQFRIPLAIETNGSKGLRYRTAQNGWKTLLPFRMGAVRDTAGAGDWCSAGIIHCIRRTQGNNLMEMTASDIEYALNYGQALAAVNCLYEGARGAMHNLSRQELHALVADILNERTPNFTHPVQKDTGPVVRRVDPADCPVCS